MANSSATGAIDESKQRTVADLSQATVCLQALDNLWLPDGLLDEMKQSGNGTPSGDIIRKKEELVRNELFRALLNAKQIVVNRAAFMNNIALANLYKNKRERDAFAALLSQEAILPFVLKEKDPCQRPDFDIQQESFDAWLSMYKRAKPSCVRLSWNDEENANEIKKRFFGKFHEYGCSLAENGGELGILGKNFGISEDTLKKVINWFTQKSPDAATRDGFYREFITPYTDDVSSGKINVHKDSSFGLKKLVDLQYCTIFSDALSRYSMTPADSLKRSALVEKMHGTHGVIETVDEDEFSQAIIDYVCKAGMTTIYQNSCLAFDDLSLSDIEEIRNSDAHCAYITGLENFLKDVGQRQTSGELLGKLGDYGENIQNILELYGRMVNSGANRLRSRFAEKIEYYTNSCIDVGGFVIAEIKPEARTYCFGFSMVAKHILKDILSSFSRSETFPVTWRSAFKTCFPRNDVPEFQQSFFKFNVKQAKNGAEDTFKTLYDYLEKYVAAKTECTPSDDREATINECPGD
jgi:hypothetical protein